MTEPTRPVRRVVPVNTAAMSFDATPSGEVELNPVSLTFVDFYRQHRIRVARALALTLGDAQLGDEATDEAMTRAYQHWGRVSRLENPGGWVYRVGLNWSLSILRRLRRPDRTTPSPGFSEPPAIDEPAVTAALRGLSVEHRSVVVCRHLLGWSEAETATALGIRRGTVKSRTARALTQLRDQLHHLGPEATS